MQLFPSVSFLFLCFMSFFSSIFSSWAVPLAPPSHRKRSTSDYHWVSCGCCVDKRSSCLYSAVAVFISVVPNIVKAPTSH